MECSNHHVNFTGCCQCLVASKQVSRPRPSRINLKPSSAHQLGAYNKSNLAVFHITIEKKKMFTLRGHRGLPASHFAGDPRDSRQQNFWIHKQLPCLGSGSRICFFWYPKKVCPRTLDLLVCDCEIPTSHQSTGFFLKTLANKYWDTPKLGHLCCTIIFNLFFFPSLPLSLLGSLHSFIRMVTNPLKLLQSTTENG